MKAIPILLRGNTSVDFDKCNNAILEILKKSQNDSESLGKRNRFQGKTMSSSDLLF